MLALHEIKFLDKFYCCNYSGSYAWYASITVSAYSGQDVQVRKGNNESTSYRLCCCFGW